MFVFAIIFVHIVYLGIGVDADIIGPYPIDPLPCENPNEQFGICVLPRPCWRTCENRHLQIFCKAPCHPGCECIPGYVRDENELCVHPSDCDKNKCPPNQVIGCINPCVENTCENSYYRGVTHSKRCYKICILGCICRKGWVFRSNQKKCCIPEEKCPTCCAVNREFKECGPMNPKSCDNTDEVVCSEHCNRGCFCKEGLVEDGNGNCIPERDCPANCGENELEDPCVNPCQPTCSNPNPSRCHFLKCNKGCVCKPPYIRDENSKKCVSREDCHNTCPGNQTYTEAGKGFNCMTCSNYQLVPCATIEEAQCICNPGFVHDDDTGECISTTDCP